MQWLVQAMSHFMMILFLLPLDIDECLADPCDTNATCHNTNGSFVCTCDDNFSGDGFNCTRLCENGYQLNKSSMVCGKYQHTLSFILWASLFIVYTECSDGDLRLVDSERIGEGRVEICFNNTYGSICADFWDEVDAQVVCGQLGFMRNGQTSLTY